MMSISSVVSYVGVSASGRCGYCKSSKRAKTKIDEAEKDESSHEVPREVAESSKRQKPTSPEFEGNSEEGEEEEGDSIVFGLWAHRLTVQAYQKLVDLGWRRSGRYLYKPLMERTCCPQYSIRLDIHRFRLSRTQKRVLKTMYNYLKFDAKPSAKAIVREEEEGQTGRRVERAKPKEMAKGGGQEEEGAASLAGKKRGQSTKKKKEIRRRRAEERLRARGKDPEEYKKERAAREEARRRTLQSYLEEYSGPGRKEGWRHSLEVRLVAQPSPQLEADLEEEFQLFKRYQVQIHKDDPKELSPTSFTRFLAASPLIPEKPLEEEVLPGEGAFPGKSSKKQGGRVPLGSYHQQYRLDGRIIAVGVVDLLPGCLSAKYFFYDPELAFLSLGTYSALREIAFTQQLAARRPSLHFYYMGFFLFDCPKMRYKGRFRPSDLLCDHCFRWVPLSECEPLIEAKGGKFSTFHPDNEPDKSKPREEHISQIQCIFGRRPPTRFGQLLVSLQREKEANSPEELIEKVRNFALYAGPAATEIVLAL